MFVVWILHLLAAPTAQQTWIDLCRKARIDPRGVVDRNLDRIFEITLAASQSDRKVCLDRSLSHLAFSFFKIICLCIRDCHDQELC
jgi:hypothetical protein